ncbi:MAG: glycoside hydrolase family 31 protein [Deltaproteobacteria bacterium]
MRRWLPFLFALAACSGGDEDAPRFDSGPYRAEVSVEDRTILIGPEGAPRVRFEADAFVFGFVDRLEEDLSYDPFWLIYDDALFDPTEPPGLRWRTPREMIVADNGNIDVIFEGGRRASLAISTGAEGAFRFQLVPDPEGAPIAFMRLRVRSHPTEAFYGLGEHLDDVDSRGKIRSMQLEPDLSLEGASNEAHVPVPLLIGTTGWGLFVESRRFGVFDVAREEDDLVEITYGTAEASDEGLVFHVFLEEHPLDITKHYYDVTTPPLLPAEWVYGPLIWRDENRDQAEVEDDIRRIRSLDLATSGIWIDRPYATAVGVFDFKPDDYTDPAAMIRTAHDAGLRVALWHVPYVSQDATENRAKVEEEGWFPPTIGVRLNNWSPLLDLTNADAYAWWQSNIQTYVDLGIEGFKLDYAEDLISGLGGARTAWEFADGSTERTMHDRYTRLYHRVYAETLPQAGAFLLCRAGRWGDQANASVIWPGDLDADFSLHRERVDPDDDSPYNAVGGLPASVIMGLTLGPSGFPFYGADTGGYRHSPPDEETYIRWFQQTALSAVMQVGDSSSQPPWVFTPENGRDEDTLALYRTYARLHMRLFPYVWSYARRLADDGRAILRPLGLAHPELDVHPSDTYLLGDHLLVAPVVTRGQREREVQFPSGTWYDWWNGAEHSGVETVAAPLEKLPLFIRAGGIVPMLRDNIDTLATTTSTAVESYADDPGALTVIVAPNDGESTEYTVFDGATIASRREGGEHIVDVSPGATFEGWSVEIYAPDQGPAEVTLDGAAVVPVVVDGRVVVDAGPGAHQIRVR